MEYAHTSSQIFSARNEATATPGTAEDTVGYDTPVPKFRRSPTDESRARGITEIKTPHVYGSGSWAIRSSPVLLFELQPSGTCSTSHS